MAGSCCGGSSKSELKVAMTAVPQMAKAVIQQPVTHPHKSECCNDKPIKNEKHGCGC